MKKLLMTFICFVVLSYLSSCNLKNKDSDLSFGSFFQLKSSVERDYYTNPIIAGDHADPSVLRVGNDYYMTFSSIMFTPGLIIWHSTDLVNWEPVGSALDEFIGSVWAPDFIEHEGTYYIYFPALGEGKIKTMVVTAPSPEGPWSMPVDVGADGVIDPGHIVDEEGQRYLFLNKGLMVRLSENGLQAIGEMKEVYSGWNYPEEWHVECFCLESPKLKKIEDYYYLMVAQGGTAGVPTSHMVVSARSKSVSGPWENSPFNPILHTYSSIDKWWSVGHGSLIDTPEGDWYIIYHGYLNGYYNLGRHALMEPIHWTKDGWFSSVPEVDRAKPIRINHKINHKIEQTFSDDFSTNRIGTQWQFFRENHSDRCRFENKTLSIDATGNNPSDCNLTFVSGDKAYEMEVEIAVDEQSKAGLLLFYNESKYCGISFSDGSVWQEINGQSNKIAGSVNGNNIHLKIKNEHHVVSMYFSHDKTNWTKLERSLEVSNYNHNAYGGFLSLRPGIFASGAGRVQFKKFIYKKL